jgi:hypothetical protein
MSRINLSVGRRLRRHSLCARSERRFRTTEHRGHGDTALAAEIPSLLPGMAFLGEKSRIPSWLMWYSGILGWRPQERGSWHRGVCLFGTWHVAIWIFGAKTRVVNLSIADCAKRTQFPAGPRQTGARAFSVSGGPAVEYTPGRRRNGGHSAGFPNADFRVWGPPPYDLI